MLRSGGVWRAATMLRDDRPLCSREGATAAKVADFATRPSPRTRSGVPLIRTSRAIDAGASGNPNRISAYASPTNSGMCPREGGDPVLGSRLRGSTMKPG